VLAALSTNRRIREPKYFSSLTIIEVSLRNCNDGNTNYKYPSLPDKMLYNIGLDAAPTEIVCIVPAGMILDLTPVLAPLPIPGLAETNHSTLFNEMRVLDYAARGMSESSGPPVVVFPAYIDTFTQGTQVLPLGANERTHTWIPFPFKNDSEAESLLSEGFDKSQCSQVAEDQPDLLIKDLVLPDYTPKSPRFAEWLGIPIPNRDTSGSGLVDVQVVGKDGSRSIAKVGNTLIRFAQRELLNEKIRFRAAVGQ
jgi:hypothetical protein